MYVHYRVEVCSANHTARFEKSLVTLIHGMRQQKGSEKEYIQARLRECRKEVKSQDMSEYGKRFLMRGKQFLRPQSNRPAQTYLS
jgi:hypothetical protein